MIYKDSGCENVNAGNAVVKIRNLLKIYGDRKVFSNVSFDIYDKSINVLLGDSGSGKSSLLGILAGLIKRNSGEIYVDCEECEVKTFRANIGEKKKLIFN